MRHHLSIDLETFSSVPIGKAGAYKYVQSPDFEILLFAYSVDDGPMEIVDLAQGEVLPDWLYKAVESPEYTKHAYNAAFEWYCLSKFYGHLLPVDQWRDTMLHGLYCGYTAGLDATGKALGLPAEKQKLSVGKALIRYFCVPCTPTQSNGGRHRNLPKHDPDKWDLFKTYCLGDVTTEKEIERRLSAFPVPDDIEKQWQTDLLINARGVAVDMGMVRGALEIGAQSRDRLMQEAISITGLENPNSIAQLSTWLEKATDTPVTDLRKDTVAAMLESNAVTGSANRMLEIRQELGKTSTKKYDAIEAAVCADGRVRGLLQFYGANRTGRWCLTGDHEVLTPDGWVRLDAWDGGPIACWQPAGETVSFQTAKQVAFDYDGPMYEYNDKRISQISTPDHKMYVKRTYRGEWITDTVENMQAYRPAIPFTGWRRTVSGQEHEKLRVLVMVQADGHYTEDGSVRFAFKKERKIERCKMLLRKAGIGFIERKYSDRNVVEVPSRTVPLWLRQFKDKTFGPWLFNESPDVFFDELVYWDGYQSAKNSIQYVTCNRVNADLVQAFSHLSGRAALMKVRRRSKEHENWSDAYCVDIWQNPGNCHEIRAKATISEYCGRVYCAVTQTGFFLVRRNGRVWVTGNSGRLVQVQNLPRTYLEVKSLPWARQAVKDKRTDKLSAMYGSVPDTLSQLIRTSFVASEGNKLVDADFSAIEARVISWLAGEQWRLEVFRTHGKIYEASASQMFGVPLEKIKKGNPEYALRQKGKVAELALGYQGSSGALIAMGALKMGIPEDDLPDIVSRWRDSNKRIVDLWYSLESAAVSVIQTGHPAGVRGLMLAREMDIENGLDFLTITLPSRRKLYYAKPSLGENSWGRPSILYYGVNQTTKQWTQLETYGGKLVENCVQAIARDCLAIAIERLEAAGFPVVFHIHDEVVVDCPAEKADLDEVVRLMSLPIPWAPDLPLNADGWVGDFFRKD